MTAPLASDDFADAYAQDNPDGPTQASVYDGTTADPAISARTLATLAAGETPVIGARRVDHANATDYGFGADGIEYLITTSGGDLIPDVAGLIMADVLANDLEQGSGILHATLAIDTPPTQGAAAAIGGMLYYAPIAGVAESDDSLTYTVDNTLAETSNAATLTVSVGELLPVSLSPLRVGILPGITAFFDPQGQLAGHGSQPPRVLEVEITTAPTNGTASVVGRTVQYTSASDVLGEDTFSWRALVNGQWTDPAMVTVAVGQTWRKPGLKKFTRNVITAGPPSAPIAARPDDATTPYGTPITIDALANDLGSNISIVAIGAAVSGAVLVDNLDGTIDYTPPVNFSGSDSFLYTISDGIRSSMARVTVTVAPPDILANDDFASTVGETPVDISPLSNDLGTTLTLVSVEQGANGAVVDNLDGTVTYTADAGFAGEDAFNYTIEDAFGAQATGQIRVAIGAPDIEAIDNLAITVTTTPVTISPLANDIGVDLTIQSVTTPANGTAVLVNADTQIQYTAAALFVGDDAFDYTIVDAYGQTSTATITVTVNAVAGPNVVAVDDNAVATSGVARIISPLVNDAGTGLTISAVSTPAHGAATRVNANTQIQYTATPPYIGADSFTYDVTDGVDTDQGLVTVTVGKPGLVASADEANANPGVPVIVPLLTNDIGSTRRLVRVGLATASCSVLDRSVPVSPELPVSTTFVNAANYAELVARINAAGPGTCITLTSTTTGAYAGANLTKTLTGTATNPIVIRGPADGPACGVRSACPKIPFDLVIDGAYVFFYGLDFNRGTSSLTNSTTLRLANASRYITIRRCWAFRKFGNLIRLNGTRHVIDFCDLSVWGVQEYPTTDGLTPAPNATKANWLPSGPFQCIYDGGAVATYMTARRNYVHDCPFKMPDNYSWHVVTGFSNGDNPIEAAEEAYWLVKDNLVWKAGHMDIATKTSRNTIQGNTIDGSGNKTNYNQRSGNYNDYLSNWYETGTYSPVFSGHGGFNKWIGNRLPSGKTFVTQCGDHVWTYQYLPSDPSDREHNSHRALYWGNLGAIQDGYRDDDAKTVVPTETQIVPTVGQSYTNIRATGANTNATAPSGYSLVAAVKLTAANVGPGAPWVEP